MRTLKKVRKISHDNFVESYGIVTRSKSVEGRTAPKKASSQSSEIFGTFRRRKTSFNSVDENFGQTDKSFDINDNCDGITSSSSHRIMEISSPQLVVTSEEDNHQTLQVPSEKEYKGPSNRRLRRFSLKKFPSTGDIRKMKNEATGSTPDLSQDDGSSLSAEAPARITSWHAQFSINKKLLKGNSSTSLRSKSPKRSLFQVPALSMATASQSGYMDRRNKKKKWEKLWCVLNDTCLFCYHSPQSEFTQDAVVLRGYTVSADISDVQKAKFTFKLDKKGHPTYHFRCDDHKTFMQWVCMIKKESSVAVSEASDNEILHNSMKNSTQTTSRTTQPANSSNQSISPANSHQSLSRRHTSENIFRLNRREHLELELQKENLLREVLEQQKEIIKERNSILSSPSPEQSRPYYVPLVRDLDSPKPTKNEVMDKYERVKETQQMKILKSLTQLHRRRNSVQLKIDQLSRDSKPKRRSRHANRYVIHSMEARLDLLRSELSDIDRDIREHQASKEDIMDSLNHKRDLEIMVLDQQECLDIVRRGQSSPFRYQQERGRGRTRRQSNVTVSSSSSYMTEHLTSIDETTTVISHSDSSSTSSGLYNSCIELNTSEPMQKAAASTPRCKSSCPFEHVNDDEIDGSKLMNRSKSSQNIAISKALSCSSDADEIFGVEGALSDDFRSLSASSYSDLDGECRTRVSSSDESLGVNKKTDEVRPDVLAEIEDFEIFSKMMLQRLHSAKC